MKRAKVTRNGQITIPQEFRKKLGIREGSVLRVEVEGESVVYRPIPRLEDLAGSLAGVASVEEVKRELDRSREAED